MTRHKKKNRAGKSGPTPAAAPPPPSVYVAPKTVIDGSLAASMPWSPATSDALVHLATVAGVCVALALATYVSREAIRMRPWEPGEGIPIVRLFQRGAEAQVASAAEPAGPVDPEGSDVASPQVALDPVLLAAATEDPEASEVEAPLGEAPVDAGPGAESLVAASEVAGLPLEIEDTSHAMDAFYRRLARTAAGEAVVTRIEHFGDSTIAFDGITQTVRERMQHRFGDAGSGFVLPTRGTLPYGHHHLRTEAEGEWRLLDITHHSLTDGRYGLGGAQARADAGPSAWYETAPDTSPVGRTATSFQVLYQRFDRGGQFDYRVDGGEWTRVDTRIRRGEPESDAGTLTPAPPEGETVEDEGASEGPSPAVEDAVLEIPVPSGAHRLSLRAMGHGETRLYGIVIENGDRGVVYDSLGMVGARAQRMLGFEPAHLASQLAARDPALIVVAFGGNDADDEREQAEFEHIFRRVAHLVRQAAPEASCLLMAPLDQAERDERGAITTLPTIPLIVEGMRQAARREGCAFFDTWTAMGGDGSMGRWFRQEPRLSGGDFRHATPAGYRVIGEMLYRALLMGFRRYQRQ